MRAHIGCYESPLGPVAVTVTEEGVARVEFVDERPRAGGRDPLLERCLEELDEYFRGVRQKFTLPLAPGGTRFQRRVWDALAAIPYGRTATYQEIATRLGNAGAARAVGGAVAQNRLAVIVPCHRVVGTGGRLTGYAWGTWRKEWLIRHEQRGLIEYRI